MPVVAAIATVAAAGVQAYSAYKQGKAEEEALNKQADVYERQAQGIIERGKKAKGDIRYQGDQIIGSQRAAYGAAGVKREGSVLVTEAETNRLIEEDIRRTWKQAQEDAWATRQGAEIARTQADAAGTAKWLNAASSILGGVAGGASYLYQANQNRPRTSSGSFPGYTRPPRPSYGLPGSY